MTILNVLSFLDHCYILVIIKKIIKRLSLSAKETLKCSIVLRDSIII